MNLIVSKLKGQMILLQNSRVFKLYKIILKQTDQLFTSNYHRKHYCIINMARKAVSTELSTWHRRPVSTGLSTWHRRPASTGLTTWQGKPVSTALST